MKIKKYSKYYTDPEKVKKLADKRNEEIKSVAGEWVDGKFVPGEYTIRRNQENANLEQIEKKSQMDPNKGSFGVGGSGNENIKKHVTDKKNNLDIDKDLSKDVKWDVLDKALRNASVTDFAAANKIDPKDVDINISNFSIANLFGNFANNSLSPFNGLR